MNGELKNVFLRYNIQPMKNYSFIFSINLLEITVGIILKDALTSIYRKYIIPFAQKLYMAAMLGILFLAYTLTRNPERKKGLLILLVVYIGIIGLTLIKKSKSKSLQK